MANRGAALWSWAETRLPDWFGTLARYAAGSVVATVVSETTLVVLYGVAHLAAGWATVAAWLAGALPNYWLNRSWAWGRRGRSDLRREVLPYIGIILATLLVAVVTTRAADLWLRHAGVSHGTRVTVVAATYFGVYVAMFVLRFVLLDRLFGRSAADPDAEIDPLSREAA